MNESLNFISSSFEQLANDMNKAISQREEEQINYIFFRTIKLLNKTEQLLESQRSNIELSHQFKLIKKKLADWYSKLAEFADKDGNEKLAESYWLSSLYVEENAEHYIQYAHFIIRSKGLFLKKEISENLENIHIYNAKDILACLKRAKLCLKSTQNLVLMNKEVQCFIKWIDLLQEAIHSNKELMEVVEHPKEKLDLSHYLNELDEQIGLTTVKQKIKELCNWVTFTELRRENGFTTEEISLHMILSGNPGTGKTTVARIIAKIYKALGLLKKGHLVEVARSDLVAEYVGQTAIKTKAKLDEARDGVLFIDEAYSLVRGSTNDFGIEAIDTIIKEMEDNRGNLIIILAGYPKEMQEFVESNPGIKSRFKFHINFPDYTICELMEIHRLLIKKKQYRTTVEADKLILQIIVKELEKKQSISGNGRFIRNLVEDEILSKATMVVEQKEKHLQVDNLDLIDEVVVKRLIQSSEFNQKDNGMVTI